MPRKFVVEINSAVDGIGYRLKDNKIHTIDMQHAVHGIEDNNIIVLLCFIFNKIVL